MGAKRGETKSARLNQMLDEFRRGDRCSKMPCEPKTLTRQR